VGPNVTLTKELQMAESEAERRWSVKVLRHLGNNTFRVTWASGKESTEPLEFLDNIDNRVLERVKDITPYPVIVSCAFVKKVSHDSFKVWTGKRMTISDLRAYQFPLFESKIGNINHFHKAPLVGRSPTEHLERTPPSAASLESVSGGCFQESELAECFYIK
jgi:hypothetical protein